jgi:hypothetical protein
VTPSTFSSSWTKFLCFFYLFVFRFVIIHINTLIHCNNNNEFIIRDRSEVFFSPLGFPIFQSPGQTSPAISTTAGASFAVVGNSRRDAAA